MATQEQCKNQEQNIVLKSGIGIKTKPEPNPELNPETNPEPNPEVKPKPNPNPNTNFKPNEIYCTYCKNNTTDIFYNNTLKNYLCWSCQDDWQECEMAGEEQARIEQMIADMKYDKLHPDID